MKANHQTGFTLWKSVNQSTDTRAAIWRVTRRSLLPGFEAMTSPSHSGLSQSFIIVFIVWAVEIVKKLHCAWCISGRLMHSKRRVLSLGTFWTELW